MSVAERLRVTAVELVYEAPLFMLTEPLGAVVSEVVVVGDGVGVREGVVVGVTVGVGVDIVVSPV